ncbi:glycosyltransferase [Desulfogranum marinum]|uniref:glycosyltransferase n=1 Tax=Desulfogranum marinum TaxID=453220 RepID=UPI0019643D1D|nr:glycosyltransferase [Desulfogranum marinum]MBM9514557.1 glycosyltransferase [Desulfogranum marinum]
MHSNKPIKVLQLGSPSGLYGAERWILALIKYLDPQKVVSVVGVIKDDPKQDAKLCQEAKALGYETIEFEAHGKVNFSIIKQLKKYLVDERIDILHTHFYKTDIVGLLATRGISCKIISTPHGWSKNGDIKLWCYEMLDRIALPFMDAVAPLSEDLYQPLKKIPGLDKKLHLIINGVDLSEVSVSEVITPDVLAAKNSGKFILGYIGQLIPRKGLEVLLKALTNVKNIDWELYLVGEGEQREELQKLCQNMGIADSVHFVGFRQDRLEFLRGFDVFVLPSRLEGIPRCLMESMAANVPIIASNIPGCNDLIIHERTGLLFKLDDHADLSSQIEKLVKSEKLRSSLDKAAFSFVTENYSAAHMAQKYQKCFINLIN